LADNFPEIDPKTINFVDLRELVLNLEEFEEGHSKCGERVLEAIQMNWIEEVE
jgi:FeS assembly protein IscX